MASAGLGAGFIRPWPGPEPSGPVWKQPGARFRASLFLGLGEVELHLKFFKRLRAGEVGGDAFGGQFTGPLFYPALAEALFELGGDSLVFLGFRIFARTKATGGQLEANEGE